MTAPDTIASLAEKARLLVELDRLFGVETMVTAAPLAPLAPIAADPPRPAPAPVPPPRATVAPPQPTPRAPEAKKKPAEGPVGPLPGWDAPELVARRAANAAKLAEIAKRIEGCTQCRLSEKRTNVVPGQGDAAAELVFVGEGPGQVEDETGLAFVGPAGELLTKMIGAMGLTRDEVYICNVVKCRPPGNRTPAGDEMATCLPYLREQLDVIRPKVICALGKTAAIGLGLVAPTGALGPARGRFHSWNGVPVMVTYHPSYLLRTPADKRKAWEDLQKIFPYLERRRPTK